MGPTLSPAQTRLLSTIFERGAEAASRALTQWLGRTVHLAVSEVDQVELAELTDLLGPADETLAVCAMGFSGGLDGQLLLVFDDRSGLSLVDILLRKPAGTASAWGDLERSAATETANIVGCAYLNALASHLPGRGDEFPLMPGPPQFRHEFAGSLLQFALMEQMLAFERVLLIKSQFACEDGRLDWILLFVPTAESLGRLTEVLALPDPGSR